MAFEQLIRARFNDDGSIVGLIPAQPGTPAPVPLSSVSGDVTVNSRDGNGRVSGYTLGGTSYTVTYNAFGLPATVSGGGQIQTYTYDASGLLVSTATA